MKVYKIYWVNNGKFYLKNRGGTEIFTTLAGARSAITNQVRGRYYNAEDHEKAVEYRKKFKIEEYGCELIGEVSND